MKSYTAQLIGGKLLDFKATNDPEAVAKAIEAKCTGLVRCRNFSQNGYMYTILPHKAKGY